MNGEPFRFWTHFLHFWQICQKEMSHFFENGSLVFLKVTWSIENIKQS